MELFLKTDLPLDDLVQRLREILNIPDRNRSPFQSIQERNSANLGGAYYLFESLGLELQLVRNEGEGEIPGWSDFRYYITLRESVPTDRQTRLCIAGYLRDVLKDAGFDGVVDTESP
jgi:hypothetical protein